MRAKADLFLLCTLCIFSVAGSAPTFTATPPDPFLAVEGSNITLEWRYNFGGGSFRQLLFGNIDTTDIVDKLYSDEVPYIAPAYKGRLEANATDAYTSITFFGLNRTDSTTYTLAIKSRTREKASSKVEISVKFVPEVMITGVQEQFGIKGRQLLLICQYNALPPVSKVQWDRDGTVIARNDSVENNPRVTIPHYNQSEVQLAINATTPQDTGNYTCLVINNVGNSSDTTSVVIQVEPNSPVNVAVDSKSSRVVNISWNPDFDGLSAIQNYTVKISVDNAEFLDADCQGSLSDTSSCVVFSTNASFENLLPWTTYYFKVFARNVVGTSSGSSVASTTTDQEEPGAAPENVQGQNSSSTSILVMWDEVPAAEQNGIITGYTITYQSQTENDNGNVQVNGSVRQTELVNLKKYVSYNITVFASTVKGDGPASDPIVVRTDQDKPDGPPQNVTGQNNSSRSILVFWDEVPADQQNGIITGYTITYQSQTENDNGNVKVNGSVRQTELTNLKEYVKYYITVFASTVKGDGPASDPIVVRTDQDRPSAPPQDLELKDTTSSSLLVGWNEVPAADKNGIIVSYTVRYQAISSSLVENLTVFFPTREVNLTGLIKNIMYSVRVLASTDKGDGNYSDPELFVTNQDVPSAAPQNVRGHNTSSNSILVTWDEVPANKQRGDILYYTVIYKETQGAVEMSKRVDLPKRSVELKGLKRYARYNIQVSAATVKGDGPASVPITIGTKQGIPSKAPVLTLVTVLNSTSVEVEWQPVPEDFRHGIITKYVILYTFEKVTGETEVPGSLLKVAINGLRQSATYSFRVQAATVMGAGPASNHKNATTEDPPTAPTPPDGNIGKTEVSVPFKTKKELSNGKPVSFYQMIVTTFTDGQNPGKSSDEQYVKVMRNYDNQVKGEPYITAEFANDQSRTSFPVGDGKYYSRDGVTEAKRKRRKTFIKYQNGKLEEGTRYAVFQRSFDEDGNYENEGFITFTTKDDGIPTATLVLSIVVGLLVLLIVAIVIVMWRRLHSNAETKSFSRNPQQAFTQEILELSPYSKASTEPSYYNTTLNELETEGQFTYEAVDGVHSGQVTHYDDVGPQQEDTYQEIDPEVHYQPLNVNRQVTYGGYVKPKPI